MPETLVSPVAPLIETQPLREIAADQNPSMTALCDQLDAYATEWAAKYPDQTVPARELPSLMNPSLRQLLVDGAQNATEAHRFATSLNALESLSGRALFRAFYGALDDPECTAAFQSLLSQEDPALLSILQRTTTPEEQSAHAMHVRAIAKIASPVYGPLRHWKRRGELAELPDFIKQFVEHPRYFNDCVDDEAARLRALGGSDTLKAEKRTVETTLLYQVLGLDPKLAWEISYAIRNNTLLKDEKFETIPLDRGGGVDSDRWGAVLRGVKEAVDAIGLDGIRRVREQCGIVNFHRYTAAEIKRMDAFAREDPAFLEQLRNNDITASVADKYFDDSGSFKENGELEKEAATTESINLCFEAAEPAELYGPFVRLAARHGIKISTLKPVAHGQPGSFAVGTPGNGVVLIGATDSAYAGRLNYIDIADTSFGRFMHEYMQPSRRSGERAIVFRSCSQARADEQGGVMSTAEAFVRLSDPQDNVVAIACRDNSNIRRDQQGAYYGGTGQERLSATEFRYDGSTVHATQTPYITPLK
jgi:hypothetical protein